jgi:hypothetical protein
MTTIVLPEKSFYGVSDCVYGGGAVFLAEDGVTRDEGICTVADDNRGGFSVDSAIDFDADVRADNFSYVDDFFGGVVDKFLGAESGMNRHNQHHIAQRRDIFYSIDRRFGIQANACAYAELMKPVNQLLGLFGNFDMKGYVIDTGINKGLCVFFRLANHQVAVEDEFAVFAKFGNNNGADGDIRDEVAVHYIEVNHFYACRFDLCYFIGKSAEIGAQY